MKLTLKLLIALLAGLFVMLTQTVFAQDAIRIHFVFDRSAKNTVGKKKSPDVIRLPIIPFKTDSVGGLKIPLDGMELCVKSTDLGVLRGADSRIMEVGLQLNLMVAGEPYQTTLNYWDKDPFKSDFPRGMGAYLFDLELTPEPEEVALVIRPIRLYEFFYLDMGFKAGVQIGRLHIAHKIGVLGHLVDDPFNYSGYDITDSYRLSQDDEEGVITFSYSRVGDEEESETVQQWNGYEIKWDRDSWGDDRAKIKVSVWL